MKKPVVLQFGLGAWGSKHAAILGLMDRVSYVGVDIDRGSYFPEVIRSVNPNMVVITTNSVNHFPIALHCLSSSIPVFVEKPIALTSGQVSALKTASENNNTPLIAGYQLVFAPELYHLRHSAAAMVSIRSGAIPRDEGAILSLATHDLALAFWSLSRPVRSFKVEGSRHDALVELYYSDSPGKEFAASIHVKSISQAKTRHTIFCLDNGHTVSFTPDNWSRVDLLLAELTAFVNQILDPCDEYVRFYGSLPFTVADAACRIDAALRSNESRCGTFF